MNSTVFDFTIRLEDSNILKLITDSVFFFFEMDYTVVEIVDRVDYSIVSQFSELANGQLSTEYATMDDYCNMNQCYKMRAYKGVFLYSRLFYLNLQEIYGYKPEFIIRGSIYPGILKLRGYENWGYLSLYIYRLVRGFIGRDIITLDFYDKLLPKIEDSVKFYHNVDYEYYTIEIPDLDSSISISPDAELVKIYGFVFIEIIENTRRKKINIFSEINASSDDLYSPIMEFHNTTDIRNLDDVVFKFVDIQFIIDSYIITLNGFVSSFGIILGRFNTVDTFVSNSIYFEYIQGE